MTAALATTAFRLGFQDWIGCDGTKPLKDTLEENFAALRKVIESH